MKKCTCEDKPPSCKMTAAEILESVKPAPLWVGQAEPSQERVQRAQAGMAKLEAKLEPLIREHDEALARSARRLGL